MERDEAQIDELAALVDEAAALRWTHEVRERILSAGVTSETTYLAAAFVGDWASEERQGASRIYLPDQGFLDVSQDDVPDEAWRLWEDIADRVTHPRAKAVLHELLFWGRRGDVGAHVHKAAESYVLLINDAAFADPVRATTAAFHLIKVARLTTLESRAVDEAIKAARAVLIEDMSSEESSKPGIALGLLRTLIAHQVQRDEVDDLLADCRTTYPGAWNTSSTIELQLRRTQDPQKQRELRREHVLAWLEEASRSEPLVAMSHYERAARDAERWGFTDLEARAVSEMQRLGRAGLPLQRIASSIDIPAERIENAIEALIGESWLRTLIGFALSPPFSGDVETNRETAREQAEQTPLQALMNVSHLGPDGLPRHTTTDEDREDAALAKIESIHTQWWAGLATESLTRAAQRFGAPTPDEVSTELTAGVPHIPEETAAAMGRVVARYTNGDVEGAAYTALPLIERLMREVLLRLNEPLYRVQQGRTPGQYPGMGHVLERLASRGLDPSWHRYLRTLLTSPVGLNFRNNALHGFVDEVAPSTSTAVLVALFYVATLGVAQTEAESAAASI